MVLFNSDSSNYMVSYLRVSNTRRKLGLGMKLLTYYERLQELPSLWSAFILLSGLEVG